MQNVDVDFTEFVQDGKGLYSAFLPVPWLADDTSILVCTEEDSIPEKLKEIIRFAVNQPLSTKVRLEKFLYDEYQSEVYGSLSGGDEVTPTISKQSEIWSLLMQPGISTPYEHWINDSHYFVVSFECVWDEEHGLGVLFDKTGNIVRSGGQADF